MIISWNVLKYWAIIYFYCSNVFIGDGSVIVFGCI